MRHHRITHPAALSLALIALAAPVASAKIHDETVVGAPQALAAAQIRDETVVRISLASTPIRDETVVRSAQTPPIRDETVLRSAQAAAPTPSSGGIDCRLPLRRSAPPECFD